MTTAAVSSALSTDAGRRKKKIELSLNLSEGDGDALSRQKIFTLEKKGYRGEEKMSILFLGVRE